MAGYVTIARYYTSAEAQVARNMLLGAGIPAILGNEYMTAAQPVYRVLGVDVQVPEELAEEGANILREWEEKPLPREHCPACGAEGVRRTGNLLTVLFSLVAWLPFTGQDSWRCPQCGKKWG